MRVWRYNPSRDGTSTWWILGGATAFMVGLGVLTMRSARAATAPVVPPSPIPSTPIVLTPGPAAPRPGPTPLPVPISIVRQGSLESPTSSAVVRVLQTQLKQLGYRITRIDGRAGPELRAATIAFENDNGLSTFTPNLELLLAVDRRYGEVFDPQNPREY